jgi:thiosulfate/3-mercaptopyruvate sulfurtransferase
MMAYTTLISPSELAQHLDNPDWVVVDCRFTLKDPQHGRSAYLAAHICGAVYAHLDEDLSAAVVPGQTGRHPLPTPERAAQVFGRLGIGPGVQVVAYDDAGGALAAVRLWWMLRWLGHEAEAVLDGGWQRWQREGQPTCSGQEERPPREFQAVLRDELVVNAEQVDKMRQDPDALVMDARARDRFRGENETIDPVAGHIPGAVSAPYSGNLTPAGDFRPPEELRFRYLRLLGERQPEQTAVYCGSGVTSIHNILAMLHAGLGEPRLYAGSWSEWITDPGRPVGK